MRIICHIYLLSLLALNSLAAQKDTATSVCADYGQLVNAGRTAYEQQDTALARLLWERALLIDARGEEAQQNIAYLMRNMPDEVVPVQSVAIVKWWSQVATLLSPDGWLLTHAVLLVLLLIAVYLWWIRRHQVTTWRRWSLVLLCLVSLTYALGHHTKDRLQATDSAVIVSRCPLHEGPDQRSQRMLSAAVGQKVWILNELGDWVEVARLDRVSGWVQNDCLVKI